MPKRVTPRQQVRRRGRRVPVVPVRDAVHFPHVMNTLLVGREVSLRALREALSSNRPLLVISQRQATVEEPEPSDLYDVGTLCEVLQVVPLPDGTMRAFLRGVSRFQVEGLFIRGGYWHALGHPVEESVKNRPLAEALVRECARLFEEVIQVGHHIPVEALHLALQAETPDEFADCITHHLPLRISEKQEFLAEFDPVRRLRRLLRILNREKHLLKLQQDLRAQVDRELGDLQREYYLREQLRIIQSELREGGEDEEIAYLREQISSAGMPDYAWEKAESELRRLERSQPSSPESVVIRGYLEWLIHLPWQKMSPDVLDVGQARRILNQSHWGLETVKERVLEYLAVRQLGGGHQGPVLCFVGPPGVGKTSIGKAIASAMGRKFIRVSLAGIRDEAEIRGHRRTYVGAFPGKILQGIRQCGVKNPVFMLDEIDKMGQEPRGDALHALLEVLDAEQNHQFVDHYVEIPFDLSSALFITTANFWENIPYTLRDRLEMIPFPSYTEDEKVQIALHSLLPKQTAQNGLKRNHLHLSPGLVREVIRRYTREAGVRQLERSLGTLCRKMACRVAEKQPKQYRIRREDLPALLGPPLLDRFHPNKGSRVGAVQGVVYTEYGGDVVVIEVALLPESPTPQPILLTGHLGEVLRESAQTAVSCVRSLGECLGVNVQVLNKNLHIHVPSASVPKEGPSAGLAIAVAYASALLGRAVRWDVALTGEITLHGDVLPVGGLREKVMAAQRAGIPLLIVPEANAEELGDLSSLVQEEVKFLPVATFQEALEASLVGD